MIEESLVPGGFGSDKAVFETRSLLVVISFQSNFLEESIRAMNGFLWCDHPLLADVH